MFEGHGTKAFRSGNIPCGDFRESCIVLTALDQSKGFIQSLTITSKGFSIS